MLEFLWFAPKNKLVYKVIRPVSAIVSAKVKMRVTPFQFSRIKIPKSLHCHVVKRYPYYHGNKPETIRYEYANQLAVAVVI